MSLFAQEPVVERDGVAGLVVTVYSSAVPSEVSRPLGYWESGNFVQIPQYYLNPNLTLDGARNAGKDTEAYVPAVEPSKSPAAPDWSQGREFCGSGPHDGVPYSMYGVGRIEIRYAPRGDISLFGNNGAGGTTVTVGLHGLVDGATVLIYDSASYSGYYTIFNVIPTAFDIIMPFVGTEDGRWGTATAAQRGKMEEITEESVTNFQIQRAPAIDVTGAVTSKLNHPFIP
jgi:hypothetical protein